MKSSMLVTKAFFAFMAVLSLGLQATPLHARASEDVCKDITALQFRMIDSSDLLRLEKKHEEITHLEARFGRVFKGPITAMKEYLGGIEPAQKSNLIEYEKNKDKIDYESLAPTTYKGIEERFRRQLQPIAARYALNNSECAFKDQCSSNGNDSSNFFNTLYYKQLNTQYYDKGNPSVVSCNYERALGKFYLSNEELAVLKKESPDLAAYFATDLGWKNACLRIPFSADGKAVIFDWKEFSKKVATSLWRAKRTAELDLMAAKFDQERAEAGCLEDGGAFEYTGTTAKPDVTEYAVGEMRNAAEVTSGSAYTSGN